MYTFVSRRTPSTLITLGLLLSACGGGGSPSREGNAFSQLGPTTFQSAAVVIGQSDFTGSAQNQGGTVGARTVAGVQGAPAEGSLYLADQLNNRVLGFNAVPTINNASANFVLGQANFTSGSGGTAANRFSFPFTTVTAGGKLFVADRGNNRVLIWNTLPTGNVPADVVLGATNFTTPGSGVASQTSISPVGIAVAGGRLFVTHSSANRVMIWNTIPTVNNAPADLVLGQVNFTGFGFGTSPSTLFSPSGVWSDGTRVVVADTGNSRILIWNALPTTNGAPADVVIGQSDFFSNRSEAGLLGLNRPFDVYSNGSQLFVSDTDNNRVLVFNTIPTTSQPIPDVVLGQSTFTNVTPDDDDQDGIADATPSARTLRSPVGVATIGTQLFVVSADNHRVLIYDADRSKDR